MKFPFAAVLSVILFVLPAVAIAQDKPSQIAKLMRTYHDFNMFEGAVLVAEQGKVIYKGAFGLANREWNSANTADTKYMIGSVSKPLTSILTLIQVQKGLLDLDKTISDYLPEYNKANGKRITIRQLLSQTSGLPNYDAINDFFPRISRQFWTREEYMKLYMDLPLAFEPGSSYNYSSWGYYTLGLILEHVSGKSYAQLMKDDLFEKTGMNSSGSYAHTQVVTKRASGYDYVPGGFSSADFRDQSNTMGTGDIYSTVEDLFKLHLAISNNALIGKELTNQMLTPGMRPWQYGFGWFNQQFKITPKDSVFANYHLGMTDGFISFMLRIPSTNSLVVFLCNASPTHFFGIANNLMRILYSKPVIQKRPVHKVMESMLSQSNSHDVIARYTGMKRDTATYYVDWIAMAQLGEQLFALQRYEDARVIQENNATEFPDKDLVMVDLARTYEKLGRKKDAIEYYKKALVLNAGYEEARNRLKELDK